MSGPRLVRDGDAVATPQLELREIEALIPYARNSNGHPPAQIAKLKASMVEFGFTSPVLVDGDGVVAGHGRLIAASELLDEGVGLRFPSGAPIPPGRVPVLSCTGWSDAQRRAYVIADNRIAQDSVLDLDMVAMELFDLQGTGLDLTLTGFDEDEVSELLAGVGGPEPEWVGDPDAVPPVPDEPVSVAGDVWVCGPHRVCCLDSTDANAWDRLMQGELADACFTDPPFNVDLGRKNRLMDKAIGGKRDQNGAIANDKMSPDEFRDLLAGSFAQVFASLKPGAVVYVAHADKVGDVFRSEFADAGFHFSQMLIWHKGQHVLGMADFQPNHESIIYGWKPGARHRWYGGRKQRTVIEAGEGGAISRLEDGRWAIRSGDQVLLVSGDAVLQEAPSTVLYEPKPAASGLHPSTKPVALVERLLSNSARGGDVVVDAFGGSGSTMIAADRVGMCARLMELSPKYVDVICLRYWQFTGRRPVHAVTGELFPLEGEARHPVAQLGTQPCPRDANFDVESDPF